MVRLERTYGTYVLQQAARLLYKTLLLIAPSHCLISFMAHYISPIVYVNISNQSSIVWHTLRIYEFAKEKKTFATFFYEIKEQ